MNLIILLLIIFPTSGHVGDKVTITEGKIANFNGVDVGIVGSTVYVPQSTSGPLKIDGKYILEFKVLSSIEPDASDINTYSTTINYGTHQLNTLSTNKIMKPIIYDQDMDLPVFPSPPIPKIPAPLPPPPIPPSIPPTIYGKDILSTSSSVVYVIDISGSMANYVTSTQTRLDEAKIELTKSIDSLPRNFRFDIESYDCSEYNCFNTLEPADTSNKLKASAWVDALMPQGATATGPAVVRALSYNNKTIVLLTDGAPNCGAGDQTGNTSCIKAHLHMIDSNNRGTRIDVYGIGATGDFKQFCLDVASHNYGTYADVR